MWCFSSQSRSIKLLKSMSLGLPKVYIVVVPHVFSARWNKSTITWIGKSHWTCTTLLPMVTFIARPKFEPTYSNMPHLYACLELATPYHPDLVRGLIPILFRVVHLLVIHKPPSDKMSHSPSNLNIVFCFSLFCLLYDALPKCDQIWTLDAPNLPNKMHTSCWLPWFATVHSIWI